MVDVRDEALWCTRRCRQRGDGQNARDALTQSGSLRAESQEAVGAVGQMGAGLFKRRTVSVFTGERLDRRLPSPAEPTGNEKHDDLVNLPLGAVHGAEHV
jgi:hypothetical protein